MGRRRLPRVLTAGAALGWAIVTACLPDYDFAAPGGVAGATEGGAGSSTDGGGGPDGGAGSGDGGGPGGGDGGGGAADASDPDAMVVLAAAGKEFTSLIDVNGFGSNGTEVTATLDRSFAIDRFEVTVGRFRRWVDANRPLPCGGAPCPLDPRGYTSMQWDPEWAAGLTAPAELKGCSGPLSYGPETTYGLTDDALPMTCVSWFDTAAFCAWEEKRLPTDLEWQYAATSGGARDEFPWTLLPTGAIASCELAIFDLGGLEPNGGGCHFPKPVGSASKGASPEGVHDLTGSVFEWIWDVGGTIPANPPRSYVSSNASDGLDTFRVRRGGAFNSPPGTQLLRNWGRRGDYPGNSRYDDLGFRCARTL